MKKTYLSPGISCVLAAFILAPAFASGQTLINENWESYSNLPAAVGAPWQSRFGGGTTPTPSAVSVVSQTVGGVTSNWALVGNNATNEPVSNPSLLATFAASTQLNVSFSFMIPANYGNSSQELFNLGYISPDGNTTQIALSLYLGPNYQSGTGMLGYKTSNGTRVDIGGAFATNQQVNVSLTNINKTTGTYDVAWSSTSGSGSLGGIALTGATAQNWNFISFGESSAVTSTSAMYVDNIIVQAVPEPLTSALLLGAGCVILGLRAHRKTL